MNAAGDGFEIVNGKSIRIIKSVPANSIKRMILVIVFPQNPLFFDKNFKDPQTSMMAVWALSEHAEFCPISDR